MKEGSRTIGIFQPNMTDTQGWRLLQAYEDKEEGIKSVFFLWLNPLEKARLTSLFIELSKQLSTRELETVLTTFYEDLDTALRERVGGILSTKMKEVEAREYILLLREMSRVTSKIANLAIQRRLNELSAEQAFPSPVDTEFSQLIDSDIVPFMLLSQYDCLINSNSYATFQAQHPIRYNQIIDNAERAFVALIEKVSAPNCSACSTAISFDRLLTSHCPNCRSSRTINTQELNKINSLLLTFGFNTIELYMRLLMAKQMGNQQPREDNLDPKTIAPSLGQSMSALEIKKQIVEETLIDHPAEPVSIDELRSVVDQLAEWLPYAGYSVDPVTSSRIQRAKEQNPVATAFKRLQAMVTYMTIFAEVNLPVSCARCGASLLEDIMSSNCPHCQAPKLYSSETLDRIHDFLLEHKLGFYQVFDSLSKQNICGSDKSINGGQCK